MFIKLFEKRAGLGYKNYQFIGNVTLLETVIPLRN